VHSTREDGNCVFEICTVAVSRYCYNVNNIDDTGQRQACAPDRHPVVLATYAGEAKTDANEKAEYGNRQERALVDGRS